MRNLVISTVLFYSLTFAFVPSMAQAGKKVSPTNVTGAITVDAKKAKALFDKGVIFVDVRSNKDYAAGRIPDSVHIELKKIYNKDSLGKHVKPGDAVVIYCNGHSCLRSSKAAAQAVSWGYNKVYYFRDGYPSWKSAGFPVE